MCAGRPSKKSREVETGIVEIEKTIHVPMKQDMQLSCFIGYDIQKSKDGGKYNEVQQSNSKNLSVEGLRRLF